MTHIRLLACVSAVFAMLSLSACSTACDRGCARQDECAEKFDSSVDVPECVEQCAESTTCINQAEIYDCYAEMKCDNGLSWVLEAAACAALCKTE